MPHGTVKCESCNWEVEGELPTPGKINYASHRREHELDEVLVKNIQDHHEDTGTAETPIGKLFGHKYFEVFLANGTFGEIEANSYTLY